MNVSRRQRCLRARKSGVVPTRVPVAPVFWESLLPSTPCVSGPASHLNTCRLVPWQEQSGTTPKKRWSRTEVKVSSAGAIEGVLMG